MKLNLCCAGQIIKEDGWVNVDVGNFEGVDQKVDLEDIWPWEDDSVDHVRCYDGPEHMSDPIHFMNEAFRVLKPGAWLEMWVPSTDGRGAFQDPTHKSFWNANSIWYYAIDSKLASVYPQIKARFHWFSNQADDTTVEFMRGSRIVHFYAVGRAMKGGVDLATEKEANDMVEECSKLNYRLDKSSGGLAAGTGLGGPMWNPPDEEDEKT